MSIIGSNILAGASGQVGGGAGYTIENSLRLRSSASAYLNRTFASAGNRKTWTWSAWVKRGALGGNQALFEGGWATTPWLFFGFISDNFYFSTTAGVSAAGELKTNAVYRDPSAWYHIVIKVDTTQATASNRVGIYVNGVLQTIQVANYPSQNTDLQVNNSVAHQLGGYSTLNFDGYITEVNFIDGQQLDPSSFGEYNEDTGVWQPTEYEGTYGTNGFYLPFSDATNTTTLAADASGNGNDWTPNNISLTSGVTYDSMTDTPTPYADGGNYAVLNPLHKSANATVSDANLKIRSAVTGQNNFAIATITLPTDKVYFEVTAGNNTGAIVVCEVGLVVPTTQSFAGTNSGIQCVNGGLNKIVNGVYTSIGGGLTTGTVLGFAYDLVNGLMTIYRDGTAVATDETIPTTFRAVLASVYRDTANDVGWEFNFGQRPFAYTPPTGFLPLHAGNLPDSTIVSGDDYFKTYLYIGNGGGLQVGEIQKPFTTYEVSNSLRLRSSASAYLNRTPATAGTRTKFTFSAWVKRGQLGTRQSITAVRQGTSDYFILEFQANDTLNLISTTSGAVNTNLITSQVFRDPSAWYHVVFTYDSTPATPNASSVYLSINGTKVTSLSTATYPSQNTNIYYNVSSVEHDIGRLGNLTFYLDGYLAELNNIDGQALTPSDFGDYDGNNYWVPKAYAGTYGTNGFYLDFSDTTSTATLVADQSGAGNDWTPNNISLTAGATYDSMVDSPTPYADAGNYCTLDPLFGRADAGGAYGTTNGNLTGANIGAGGWAMLGSTMFIPAASGKYYFECTVGAAPQTMSVGVQKAGTPFAAPYIVGYAGDANGYSYANDGYKFNNGSSAYGTTATVGDVIGVAIDASGATSSIEFYKNGTSMGVAFTGISGGLMPALSTTAGAGNCNMNFGQRPFAYTPPTDFKTLNSFNIPEVTDDLETPDLVWIKSRSAAQSHTLFDSVRGVHNYLESDDTAIEATDVNSLLQFNKNGFLLGASAAVNTSGNTYAGWGWKAGTAFSNDAGTNGATIASVGSVNQDAGFSIVTYTGNGTSGATVSHGLSVAPSLILPKVTSRSGDNWHCYHSALGGTKGIILNVPNKEATDAGFWNNTNPSSSVFTLGTYNVFSEQDYVAYCFAEVEGYSKFGSYTGNGLTDGIFVHLGFKPKFILVKCSSNAFDWHITDTSRSTYNQADTVLFPNLPNQEANGTGYYYDILSNGFKCRNLGAATNGSGYTYIYMAFAENPFKNSLAR